MLPWGKLPTCLGTSLANIKQIMILKNSDVRSSFLGLYGYYFLLACVYARLNCTVQALTKRYMPIS